MSVRYDKYKEFVSSVINDRLLDEAIEWIKSNLSPEDVFDESDLEDWAEDNGYKKSDE